MGITSKRSAAVKAVVSLGTENRNCTIGKNRNQWEVEGGIIACIMRGD